MGQEPETCHEALRRQREEKSQQLAPPERSGLERALFDLESGRLLERVLNPPEGFYPKIGNITAGSGFSFGPRTGSRVCLAETRISARSRRPPSSATG